MTEYNVVLTGVGGQGVLLFAEVLGVAAVKEGFNVRVSEIHGMAQRGGAVVSDVRIGEKMLAPTVLEGTADAIVGLEPMEALRNIKCANDKTLVLLNIATVKPSATSQNTSYPELRTIIEKIRLFTENIATIDSTRIAESLGNVAVQNMVMLGAFVKVGNFPVKSETIKDSICESVPERFVELNLKAFEAGYREISRR
ncbi:MAG: indolepyruvate oxidoreductase subunit beta [Candidatus Bathyarchaeia archaeon]|jgi:indolepyruvate ferredoxin oxidoreductase beta subunit|nr:indolepyruvate oxidoreductase subunit beta [Candidatus Bathyarchaeota archaeon A05DMB-4]MDH7595460.1 indolepyruvate oxidoreductase subunit beta [Candidatus Bathyarchaeota archaeon]